MSDFTLAKIMKKVGKDSFTTLGIYVVNIGEFDDKAEAEEIFDDCFADSDKAADGYVLVGALTLIDLTPTVPDEPPPKSHLTVVK